MKPYLFASFAYFAVKIIHQPRRFTDAWIQTLIQDQQRSIHGCCSILDDGRYGGAPGPRTPEAEVGQDADALEYIGAIGILRALVRGLSDGSFDGKIDHFPEYLRSILAKVEETFHTSQAAEIGRSRLQYMHRFLERIEQELGFEA